MAEAFYPFVDNGNEESAGNGEPSLVVRHSARIAVFDDPSAAPRVVVIEPSDIRSYLEEITATVTRLAQEQGGGIPFTVIREVVENLIHAYFMEPTISILDGGDTIRFSDQGPGIADKQRALEFGTTSATAEMKHYIRGVGSGLPYAQQWLEDKGGSLVVEDNINQGTVVTVSLRQAEQASQPAAMQPWKSQQWQQQPSVPPQALPQQYGAMQQGYYQQPYAMPPAQQWQASPQPWPQGYPQQPQPAWGYPQQQPQYQPPQYQQPMPYQSQQAYYPQQPMPAPQLSDRARMALDYLRGHESVGPRDLNALYPLSESTWSRVLAQLEDLGLVSKQGGQKRRLTPAGRQLLGM